MYPVKNKKRITISLVYPAYNEEGNIAKSVNKALIVLPEITDEYEIIVVNDGSKDRTGEIVENISLEHPQVKHIKHATNIGYGGAVKSGFLGAMYDLVFLCDADLQFDLTEISNLLKWINEYDLVIGYRKKRQDSFHRRLNAWCWHVLINLSFRLKIKDIDCAFKLFSRSLLNEVKLSSNGAMVSTELLVQAKIKGFRIKEVPVNHYPRIEGQQSGANIRVVLRAFRDLFKFYREMIQIKNQHGNVQKPRKVS